MMLTVKFVLKFNSGVAVCIFNTLNLCEISDIKSSFISKVKVKVLSPVQQLA